jgi:hypothetical protein
LCQLQSGVAGSGDVSGLLVGNHRRVSREKPDSPHVGKLADNPPTPERVSQLSNIAFTVTCWPSGSVVGRWEPLAAPRRAAGPRRRHTVPRPTADFEQNLDTVLEHSRTQKTRSSRSELRLRAVERDLIPGVDNAAH